MIVKGTEFEEFLDIIKSKRLIAFGAGKFLKTINSNYQELKLEESIDYIIDNDEKKEGTYYSFGKKNIKVFSVKKLLNDDCENIVILIANRLDIKAIYNQLESYLELKNVPVFFLALMIEERVDDIAKINAEEPKEILIPKIIHFCWFSGEKKDAFSQRCLDSWKRICSDYEIIEWNADNYDFSKNCFAEGAFKAKKWAYVADYARIDVLNRYGGIYLDLDVELFKKPDALLKNSFFIGFGPIRDMEAAAFGSVSNNNLLNKMLRIYDEMKFPQNDKDLVVQPVLLNMLFSENGIKINGKFQQKDDMVIYPRNVFSGRDWFTGQYVVDENTIGIHHCVGGWNDLKMRERYIKSKDEMIELREMLNK